MIWPTRRRHGNSFIKFPDECAGSGSDLRRMHKTVRWLPVLTNFFYLYTHIYIYILYLHFSATLKRSKGSASSEQWAEAAQGCEFCAKMPSVPRTIAQPKPKPKPTAEWALIPGTHDAVGKYFAPPTARRIGSNPLSVCTDASQTGCGIGVGVASGVHGRCFSWLGLVWY